MPPVYTRKFRKYKKQSGQRKLQRWAKKRRGARSQAGQIVKLSKSIASINNRTAATRVRFGMYHEINQVAIPAVVGSSYTCYRLQPALATGPGSGVVQPGGVTWLGSPAWDNMFTGGDISVDVPSMRLGRMKVLMQFNAGNENAPVNFSVFHCKLNPEHANYMLTTFGMELKGLENIKHYLHGEPQTGNRATTSGDVTMNPNWFKVIRSWKWQFTSQMTGHDQTYSTTPSSTYKRIQFTVPLGYKIGREAGSENWRSANADTDTPDHLKNYLFVFCNNSLVDFGQSPTMSIMCQVYGTAQI